MDALSLNFILQWVYVTAWQVGALNRPRACRRLWQGLCGRPDLRAGRRRLDYVHDAETDRLEFVAEGAIVDTYVDECYKEILHF